MNIISTNSYSKFYEAEKKKKKNGGISAVSMGPQQIA